MGSKNGKPVNEEQSSPQSAAKKASLFQRVLVRFKIVRPSNNHDGTESNTKDGNKNTDALGESEWTTVPLEVPQAPLKSKRLDKEKKILPVPPPRKRKNKISLVPAIFTNQNNNNNKEINQVPVEEAVIVPQKLPIHICDGTHRHVTNVVNGKVVDVIINNNASQYKRNADELVPFDDSIQKVSSTKNYASEKNSSSISLPIEKSPKKSNAALDKLESVMMRCKSLSSVLPHSNKKMKDESPRPKTATIDRDNTSDGIEGWGLGVIENEVCWDPIVETSKVAAKQKALKLSEIDSFDQALSNFELKKNNNVIPIVHTERKTSHNDSNFMSITEELPSNSVPNEPKKDIIKGILRKTKTENKHPEEVLNEQPEVSLDKSYPFISRPNIDVFDSDSFYTSEFLKNENLMNTKNTENTKSVRIGPTTRHADYIEDSDNLKKESIKSVESHDNKEINFGPIREQVTDGKDEVAKLEHSSLLRIIQENTSHDSTISPSDGSAPLRNSLEVVENKLKRLSS